MLKNEREKYTGTEAEQYESRRAHQPHWKAEQYAVDALVERGPVLDVPIGTGRYLPIYQRKGLRYTGCDVSADMIHQALQRDPHMPHKIGSILRLPFNDGEFAAAVCTRLLNWFEPAHMQAALRELQRVAQEVVFSIRVGEGAQCQKTYTHRAGDVLDALDGAWVAREIFLRDEGPAGTYHMVHIRRPTWADVEQQFSHQVVTLQALADEWAGRYGLAPRPMKSLPVRCEYWSHQRIADEVDRMAEREPRLKREGAAHVAKAPYTFTAPITVLDYGSGMMGLADGRHRVDKWRRHPGRYPVFVVDCAA